MSRYYFDCPIKAAYMMKEFGIELVTELGNKYWKKDILYDVSDLLYDDFRGEKYFVAEESESIFEPKESDVIDFLGKITTIDSELSKEFPTDQSMITMESVNKYLKECPVVMRDGKHFFQPLKED